MAPVYKEIEMEWEGVTYKVTPTYAMIQRIEQRISLASLMNRTLAGQPPLSQLADLIATVLKAAGCKDKDATAENINAELYDADSKESEQLQLAASAILFAMLPQKVSRGNAEAPEAGADKDKTKTNQSQQSTGQSTTELQSAISGSNPPNSGE